MTKAELVGKVSHDAGITKAQAEKVISSLTETITNTLKKGGKVSLAGFGTFSVTKRAARSYRNPQTGAPIRVKKKSVAKFKAGQVLRRDVGGGTDDTGPMKTRK